MSLKEKIFHRKEKGVESVNNTVQIFDCLFACCSSGVAQATLSYVTKSSLCSFYILSQVLELQAYAMLRS